MDLIQDDVRIVRQALLVNESLQEYTGCHEKDCCILAENGIQTDLVSDCLTHIGIHFVSNSFG